MRRHKIPLAVLILAAFIVVGAVVVLNRESKDSVVADSISAGKRYDAEVEIRRSEFSPG